LEGDLLRNLRAIALAVVAASVLVAFVGTSGAAAAEATKLCKVNEAHCSVANTYPFGTALESTGGSVEIKLPKAIGAFTCPQSNLSGHTVSEGASGELLVSGSLTFTSCSLNHIESCSFSSFSPLTSELIAGPNGYGTEVFVPSAGSEIKFAYVQCPGLEIQCEYTAPSITAYFKGGPSGAEVVAEKSVMKASGGKCPGPPTLSATWGLGVNHKAVYLTH
jgi:hypothetical protein